MVGLSVIPSSQQKPKFSLLGFVPYSVGRFGHEYPRGLGSKDQAAKTHFYLSG